MTAYQTTEAGFRIVEDVLSPQECDDILAALSSPDISRGRAGVRHLMSLPLVARLASDPRLLEIAGGELGKPQQFPVEEKE